MREKISKFTLALQNQDIVPLWAIANDNLILSAATDQKHIWKNKAKKVFSFIKITSVLKLQSVVIFLVGLYKLASYFCFFYKNNFKHKTNFRNTKKLFFGHGANAEKFIFDEYVEKNKTPILKINIITLQGLEEIGFPSIPALFWSLCKNTVGLNAKIQKLSKLLNLNAHDFLTVAAFNIGEYVFFKTFFRLACSKGVEEVVFLTQYIGAHACVDEKIKTVYLAHGLIRLSVAMVKSNLFLVVTPEEKKYIQYVFNNNISCKLLKKYIPILKNKQNIIFIMPPETFALYPEITKTNFFSFLEWAKSTHYKIILRPSPKTSEADFLQFERTFSSFCELDNAAENLEEKLKTLMPKFVVSQNTTGFYTALSLGILPISVCDPDADFHVYDNVYPLKQKVLFWPKDIEAIKNAIIIDSVYDRQIRLLQNASDNELFLTEEKILC